MSKVIALIAKLKGGRKTKKGLKGIDSGLKSIGKSALAAGAAYFSARGIISGLQRSIELSSKMEGVERGFKNLSASAGFTTQAFSKLQKATDGTISSIDLMKQANNAMLLGIADSEDQMADMFDVAQRLASALGQDATFGVESLVTGMGRQSKLMLDNLGIMVDTEKAYETYAKDLGISVELLTDQQRKQAFVNAAMSSAKDLVSDLGAEQLTTADSISQTKVALNDMAILIGETFSPFVIDAINNITPLIEKAREFFGIIKGQTPEEEIESIEFAIKKMTDEMNDFILAQQGGPMSMEWIEELLKSAGAGEEFLSKFFSLDIDKQVEILKTFSDGYVSEIQALKDRLAEIIGPTPPGGISEEEVEIQRTRIQQITDYWDGLSEKQRDNIKEHGKQFTGNLQNIAKAPGWETMGKAAKRAAQIQAMVDAYAAANAAMKAMSGIPVVGPALGVAAYATALASGLASVKQIESAATGFDGVVNQPTLFMTGEGNKAERVSVTPLQSPNINGPQGGGGIHLHFGAVTNEDYVKDFIVPEIQKAQRLNLA